MTTRRRFLAATALAGFAAVTHAKAPAKPLRLLILGGTGFLGPHVVDAALARGHAMSLFNRGKTNPGLFPALEKLHGDRRSDLSELAGRQWDAVIDTSGFVPSEVTRSAALLAPNVGHYVFVSSTDVYRRGAIAPLTEDAPVATLADASSEVVTPVTHGPLKALCEQAAEAAMPGRTTSLRAGLLVGPGDPTDRFTYWPARVARGGEVLAPGAPDDPLQFIDVRDLAGYIVACIERRATGVHNVASGPGSVTMGQLLEGCRLAARSDARLTWVPATFLREQGVATDEQLPVWSPSDARVEVDVARANAAGLALRAPARTVADTLAWYRSWPDARRAALRAGLTPAREAEVLAAWRAVPA
ncbi:MAG TPA: NAD-dependent epimerase/dehydratase family protein [Xanthomonadales bacterium]|nr:NAD-dependent epimerase/dehydratase family protein [Xanthomonadales bacterium]